MSFGPKKISLLDVLINTLGSCVAGFIGSIIILLIVFVTSSMVSIPGTFEQARLGTNTNSMFPFILSFITFISATLVSVITAKFLSLTAPDRYNITLTAYGQIGFLGILTYLFLTPIYITTGVQSYENIMIVFLIHIMIVSFGNSIILELLTNYRYVLVGLYGSFIGLFASGGITTAIFFSIETGQAKLLSLLILLPLIGTLVTLSKGMFELAYYRYHLFSGTDGLGDIFYRIEKENAEALREEELKNSL